MQAMSHLRNHSGAGSLQRDAAAQRTVHVVAAVLRDAAGRVLLTRREGTRDWAGTWEFPGGKVEAGESAIAALRRELREELGIGIGAARPLIAVPQCYPHKRIVLDVHEIAAYDGVPQGREGQRLQWIAPERLGAVTMPPADRPVVAALMHSPWYLVTPAPGDDDETFIATLDRVAGDVRRWQLRLPPTLPSARARRLLLATLARADAHRAELLVNSAHADAVALARERDLGLHLRAADLLEPPDGARWVAASCHDADELRRAEQLGCAFAVLGPVAPTSTHAGATTMGWDGFATLRAEVAMPVYGLGGLRADELALARGHGAQGIAAIRALWPASATANPDDR
jgi:8-oxo-dGTP diphosphatase